MRPADIIDPFVPIWAQTSNQTIGNSSLDVMLKACFHDFDSVACTRNIFLTILVLATAFLCLIKVVRIYRGGAVPIQYKAVFLLATLLTILCAANWLIGGMRQFIDFFMLYTRLLIMLCLAHLYTMFAIYILRKQNLIRWLLALLVVLLLYFTAVVALGVMCMRPNWIECLQPQWIMLSSVECLVVQLFLVSAFYISRRLDEISTAEHSRRSQKRQIWSVVLVFELSCLVSIAYDLALLRIADVDKGCSGVFSHSQVIYTSVVAPYILLKYIVPIWVLLVAVDVPDRPESIDSINTRRQSSEPPNISGSSSLLATASYEDQYAYQSLADSYRIGDSLNQQSIMHRLLERLRHVGKSITNLQPPVSAADIPSLVTTDSYAASRVTDKSSSASQQTVSTVTNNSRSTLEVPHVQTRGHKKPIIDHGLPANTALPDSDGEIDDGSLVKHTPRFT